MENEDVGTTQQTEDQGPKLSFLDPNTPAGGNEELVSTPDPVVETEAPEVPATEEEPVETQEPEKEVVADPEPGDVDQVIEITDDVEKEQQPPTPEAVEEPVQADAEKEALPEWIQKLVDFNKETGGGIEEYSRINQDYSQLNEKQILAEYYKQTKPKWDNQDILDHIEDTFDYNAESFDQDDKSDRRARRLYQDEIEKATEFLNTNKEKYYTDLKSNPMNIPQEYKESIDFHNEYKQNAEQEQKLRDSFIQNTDQLFNEEFQGFGFDTGEKKFLYKVGNANSVKESQTDLLQSFQQYLGDGGELVDAKGYHKALFAANNADKLAKHFYETGKADALKERAKDTRNVSTDPVTSYDSSNQSKGQTVKFYDPMVRR